MTMADRSRNLDTGEAAKVVQLHGGEAAPKRRRRGEQTWLAEQMRDLVHDVDVIAGELDLTALRRPVPPPVAETVAVEPTLPAVMTVTASAVRVEEVPVSAPVTQLLRVAAPVSLPRPRWVIRSVRAAAQRIPDPHMRMRSLHIASTLTFGWPNMIRRMAVAVRAPEAPPEPFAVVAVTAAVAPAPVVAVAAASEGMALSVAEVHIAAPEPVVAVAAPAPVAVVVMPPVPAVIEPPIPSAPVIEVPSVITDDDGYDDEGTWESSWDPETVTYAPERTPWWSRLLSTMVATAMALTLVICATIVGTVLTGHKLETVVTGSMVPTIPIGSMVVAEKVRVDSLRPGDVLIFQRPDSPSVPNAKNEVIVHRIIDFNDLGNGEIAFTTKGDANPVKDCWAPPDNCQVSRDAHALADRAIFVLPGFGNLAAILQAGAIFFVAIVGALMVIGWGVRQIRRALAE